MHYHTPYPECVEGIDRSGCLDGQLVRTIFFGGCGRAFGFQHIQGRGPGRVVMRYKTGIIWWAISGSMWKSLMRSWIWLAILNPSSVLSSRGRRLQRNSFELLLILIERVKMQVGLLLRKDSRIIRLKVAYILALNGFLYYCLKNTSVHWLSNCDFGLTRGHGRALTCWTAQVSQIQKRYKLKNADISFAEVLNIQLPTDVRWKMWGEHWVVFVAICVTWHPLK